MRAVASPAEPSMTKRKIDIAAAVLLLLALIFCFFIIRRSRSSAATSSPPTRAANAQAPATNALKPLSAPAPGRTLRVGVYMSKITGDQWGYSVQIVNELLKGKFDLVPILESGTKDEEGIAKVLNSQFVGKPIIDAADAEALKKLDVIVAPRIWLLPDDARAAIEAAVTNGTGLLARNGLGCMSPGSGADVSRLSGFDESHFGYNPHPMDCE
jgi:hypothetical protein